MGSIASSSPLATRHKSALERAGWSSPALCAIRRTPMRHVTSPREVFPLIRKEWPAAEFWIVGADPPPSLRELSGIPGIKVTGTVDERQADPVRIGHLRLSASPRHRCEEQSSCRVCDENPCRRHPEQPSRHRCGERRTLPGRRNARRVRDGGRNASGQPAAGRHPCDNSRMLIEQHYSWCKYGAVLERALAGVRSKSHSSAIDMKECLA